MVIKGMPRSNFKIDFTHAWTGFNGSIGFNGSLASLLNDFLSVKKKGKQLNGQSDNRKAASKVFRT